MDQLLKIQNSKYEYGNFPNESLGQEKHFKHVFRAGEQNAGTAGTGGTFVKMSDPHL